MRSSYTFMRIRGIRISVHFTWLFAVAFIALTLSEGFFPAYFSGWSTATYWGTGILASLLLFLSVLVHELAHSFVAQARGLKVEGITLFIFGGVSNMGSEATRARDEFMIAVVGPLTSLVLAALFWALYLATGDGDSPVVAVLFYLGYMNALLAVFNMMPGFPLDGGRVLRSVVWGVTGNLSRATNIAAWVGQAFGWSLVGLGVYQILQGSVAGGLWMAVIGWFLSSIAGANRRGSMREERFRGVLVDQVMDRGAETVSSGTSVEVMIREHFVQRGSRAALVVEDGRVVGIATLTDVKAVPQDRWAEVRVGEIMTREPLYSVDPDDELGVALRMLAEHNLNQVIVLSDGQLVGLLSRADVIRYLQYSWEPGGGLG